MEKYLIRSNGDENENNILQENDVVFNQPLIDSFFQVPDTPNRKRKLIDRIVVSTSEKVRRTLNNYASTLINPDESDHDSIFSSITDAQLINYTNFTRPQFEMLYLELEPFLMVPHQKGRKSKYSLRDNLFLYLLRLKTGATYEVIAADFDIKNASSIYRICEKLEPLLHKAVLNRFFFPLKKMEQEKRGIKTSNFPEVLLIVDSTLQPIQRPAMNFDDSKIFFSGKDQTYGIKKETAHLPDGRIAYTFPHAPGAKHDVTLFREHLEKYNVFSIFFIIN